MMHSVALLICKADITDEISFIIRSSSEVGGMRAHTVIFGAGVTVVTIPNDGRLWRKSSVMNGLIEKLLFKRCFVLFFLESVVG